MRELAVRIRFVEHSLGNCKERGGAGRFLLPRNLDGHVTFMATWHQTNTRFAAQVLGRHQDEVRKIMWDVVVDGHTKSDCWYKRWYSAKESGKRRYVLHEAFVPGQIVGFNCVVPPSISHDDFWSIMTISGKYKGISQYKPGQYGFFVVESIMPRRSQPEAVAEVTPAQ